MRYILIIFLILINVVYSQNEKTNAREGNKLYEEGKYKEAQEKYSESIKENPNYDRAFYNLGNSLYRQNDFENAQRNYENSIRISKDKKLKSDAFHNLGNSFMQQKKYQEALNSYKESLKIDPANDETRYNYALAEKYLQEQKQDQKNDKNKDKNDGDGDKNEKEKNENKEDNKQNKGNKDEKNDKNKDTQDQKENNDPGKEKQKGEMMNILESLDKKDNDVQKKINLQKIKSNKKSKKEKDW